MTDGFDAKLAEVENALAVQQAAGIERLRDALLAWRNWSDEVAPPWGSKEDRSDDGQRAKISVTLAGLTAERDALRGEVERLRLDPHEPCDAMRAELRRQVIAMTPIVEAAKAWRAISFMRNRCNSDDTDLEMAVDAALLKEPNAQP